MGFIYLAFYKAIKKTLYFSLFNYKSSDKLSHIYMCQKQATGSHTVSNLLRLLTKLS